MNTIEIILLTVALSPFALVALAALAIFAWLLVAAICGLVLDIVDPGAVGGEYDPIKEEPRTSNGSYVPPRNIIPPAPVLIAILLLTGCAPITAYNSHVGAREDSLSGYSKDGNYGGQWTHRVEYRP